MIADEAAIGMINNKTTAVRVIPVPNKGVGDFVEKENKIKAKIIFLSLFDENKNKIEDKQYEALRGEGICSDMQGTELQLPQKTNCD